MTKDQLDALIAFIHTEATYRAELVTDKEANHLESLRAERTLRAAFDSECDCVNGHDPKCRVVL